MPQASVVIPTHNRASILPRTLRAVLNQRDVDLEVVVVDDGSCDSTAAVVASLGDARIRLERHPRPQGVSAARNRGIEKATGEWVAFLDDDDLWAPDKLSSQIAAAVREDCGWAYAGTVQVADSLRVVSGAPPPPPEKVVRYLPWRNTVRDGASNVIVRRHVLDQCGIFDASLRHMADWDLWIRLAQTGAPAMVSRPLVAYVLHPTNASLDTAGILPEFEILNERYRTLRGGRSADRAYVYRWIAWSCLRAGRSQAAASLYLRATRDGDLKSLARLVVALVDPGVARRGYGRRGAQPAWQAEAESWLKLYAGDL